jgi:hypothetical protein
MGVIVPVGFITDIFKSLIPQETYNESAPELEVNITVG